MTRFHFAPRWQQVSNVRPSALIVGATGSIGRAVAQQFAALGFNLVLCSRNTDRALDALRDELQRRSTVDLANELAWKANPNAPRHVHTVELDLAADPAQLRAHAAAAIAKCGHSLEVAVLCAGTIEPKLLLAGDGA